VREPNRWETHCGMGQAKKWKASVRVVLENAKTMPVVGALYKLNPADP
jgi:hypothetical protein